MQLMFQKVKLFFTICLLLLNTQFATAKPKPKVQANSSDFSITTNIKNSVSFSISMDSEEQKGQQADWWLTVKTNAGWFYYDYNTESWINFGYQFSNMKPSYQGSLVNFDRLVIDSAEGLPSGRYELFFAVDLTMDGDMINDEIFQDSVLINVTDDRQINVAGSVTILDISEQNKMTELHISALDEINLSKAKLSVIEKDNRGNKERVIKKIKVKKILNSKSINLAIVLDRSGSLNSNEENLMEQGVLAMLDSLRNGDQVEIINAATNFYVDASFKNYQAKSITHAITEPSISSGWTRIYDAIIEGIEDAAKHSPNSDNQNAVLVITDGEDNRSESTLSDVIRIAKQNNTAVFIVGLADQSDPSDLNVSDLTKLAQESGGRFIEFFSPTFFAEILNDLARSLSNQFVVSYESLFTDSERTIRIRVSDGKNVHRYERVFSPIQ